MHGEGYYVALLADQWLLILTWIKYHLYFSSFFDMNISVTTQAFEEIFSVGDTNIVFHSDPVQTIGLPSVGVSPNVRYSFLVVAGLEPMFLSLQCRCVTATLLSPPLL